jgi:hypothetical protein
MENNENSRVCVSFAAIDPFVEKKMILPTETKASGSDMIEWGERNLYPEYLLDLYKTTPSLNSVVGGLVDYIAGDNQAIEPLVSEYQPGQMNHKGDLIREQVECVARDFGIFGGFALQVIRGLNGTPVEVYYIDFRFLRSNKDNTVFYYCEDWKKSRKNLVKYPAFMPLSSEQWAGMDEEARALHSSSILYVKKSGSQVYPSPMYAAALKSCEIERGIDDFHLNAIDNNFEPSAIINFNNGTPDDKMKEEIEKDVLEKFSGHRNARRIMLSFNPNKENATTFEYPRVDNFAARYEALYKHSRMQIYTSFRANPNLFGIPTDSLGFNQEEYDSAFRLFNRTCVKPVQRMICDAYDRIYGSTGVLNITPFTMEGGEEVKVN